MPDEKPDSALIREALDGSLNAFDDLMSRYQRLVYKVALSYAKDTEQVLDVVPRKHPRNPNALYDLVLVNREPHGFLVAFREESCRDPGRPEKWNRRFLELALPRPAERIPDKNPFVPAPAAEILRQDFGAPE